MKTLLFLIFIGFAGIPGNAQVKSSNGLYTQTGVAMVIKNERSTTFQPTKHGYNFGNTFYNKVTHEIVTGGRCYGMVYSALDYYNQGKAIPRQDYRPSDHTQLSKYIYDRQIGAMTNIDIINKFSELGFNPFGSRTTEFFNWGLQGFNGGRLQELKASIDAGKPVPLGLYNYGSSSYDGAHHAVLAIGYEMGRYKGDLKAYKEDLRILIYDPNQPNMTRKMKPIPSKNYYVFEDEDDLKEADRKKWMTYFVDNTYRRATPPNVSQPKVYPNDGKIYEVQILTKTGGDDLRGGRDNLNVHFYVSRKGKQSFNNVNHSERWVGGSYNYVNLKLREGISANALRKIIFTTTFTGGMGGDNWDLDWISIKVRKNNKLERWKYLQCNSWDGRKCTSTPLVRFTGDKRQFEVASSLPAPPREDPILDNNKSDKMASLRISVTSKYTELVKGNRLRATIRFKNGSTQQVNLTNGESVPRNKQVYKTVPMYGKKYGDIKDISIEHIYGNGLLKLAQWRLSNVHIQYSHYNDTRKKGAILSKKGGTLHLYKLDTPRKVYTF